jgi:hypothetical protein
MRFEQIQGNLRKINATLKVMETYTYTESYLYRRTKRLVLFLNLLKEPPNTLPKTSESPQTVFITLYKDGLSFTNKRLFN